MSAKAGTRWPRFQARRGLIVGQERMLDEVILRIAGAIENDMI
jgi:hypothetical protein